MDESNDGDRSGAALDDLFSVLAHGHRRRILDYLRDHDGGGASLHDLVDAVAEPDARVSGPERRSVEVLLHHEHLPMLVEKGFVEYDRGAGVVRTTGRTDHAELYLAFARNAESTDTTEEPTTS